MYSFGVVLLEILTGRRAIVNYVHIVEWVEDNKKTGGAMWLRNIIDPVIWADDKQKEMEQLMDIAMRCAEKDDTTRRPPIRTVAVRLRNIITSMRS